MVQIGVHRSCFLGQSEANFLMEHKKVALNRNLRALVFTTLFLCHDVRTG